MLFKKTNHYLSPESFEILFGKNTETFNVKTGGKCSNHCTWNSLLLELINIHSMKVFCVYRDVRLGLLRIIFAVLEGKFKW
jgi:hypothetical protein